MIFSVLVGDRSAETAFGHTLEKEAKFWKMVGRMDNEADDAVGGSRPGMVKQDGGRLMKVTAAAISSEHSVKHQVAIPVWKRQEHGGASYRRRAYFGAPAQDIRSVNQDHAVVEAVSDEPYQTVESRMAFLLWRPCAVRALQDCKISRPVRFLKVTEETVTGDLINLESGPKFLRHRPG
jgi:hypothetical protein